MATILIVDDELSVRHVIEQILRRNGHVCTLAATAEEARAHLCQTVFDLILLDIIMPEESGLELLRFLKDSHVDSAIVMITGIDDPQLADKALHQGAYDYIVKPIHKNRVLFSVNNAIRRRELEIAHTRHRHDIERMVRERTQSLQQTIHQLEQAQRTLKARETVYRELAQAASSVILRMAPDGRITFINNHGLSLFGREPDSVLGKKINHFIKPAQKAACDNLTEIFQRIAASPGHSGGFETESNGPDGKVPRISWTARVILDDDGQVIEILTIGNELPPPAILEKAARGFIEILENEPDGICLLNIDGTIAYANPAFMRTTGYAAHEIVDTPIEALDGAIAGIQAACIHWRGVQAGDLRQGRFAVRDKSGGTVPVEACFSPIRNAAGDVVRYLYAQKPVVA